MKNKTQSLAAIALAQSVAYMSIVPVWLLVYMGLSVAFYLIGRGPIRRAPKVLAVAFSVLVFLLYYKTQFTVEMAASFLFLACVLKLLEIRSRKDVLTYVFVMLYLSAVSFLFEQSILHTLLQLACLVLCFSELAKINGGDVTAIKVHWYTLVKVLGLSLPLVLVLFVFFPRIAPLWSIPIKTQEAKSGISSTMSPGDIASLSKSSDRAFRAKFSGERPAQAELYWRGLVLDSFDGRVWRTRQESFGRLAGNRIDIGRLFNTQKSSYEIMLEPHNERWAFVLDGSMIKSSNLKEEDMGLVRLKTDAIQPTRYKLEYEPGLRTEYVEDESEGLGAFAQRIVSKERIQSLSKQDLVVPRHSNKMTQDYIEGLLDSGLDKVALVNLLMNEFRQGDYYYTLKPPPLGDDFVDEFLFRSKRGFCSHYAGSLAYMLRLAGIPARVVIGYQGGEYNEAGGYLIVHQYDAHAWVEAKIPQYGWVRLDPTAMVAPSRVLDSLEEAVRDEGTFLSDSPLLAAAHHLGALKWLRFRFDELNYLWQKMVVNYGSGEQYSLVTSLLGQYSLSRIAGVFFVTFASISFVLIWFYVRARSRHLSKPERRYIRWLFLLSLFGLKRDVGETPRAFLTRISKSGNPTIVRLIAARTDSLEDEEYR